MKHRLLFFAILLMTLTPQGRAQSLPSNVPTDGLMAWYGFDGNADDLSGNGNHGTPGGANGGPSLVTDRFGNENGCYQFGGVDAKNWIAVSNSVSLQLDTALTVSFWIQQGESRGEDGWGATVDVDYCAIVLSKNGGSGGIRVEANGMHTAHPNGMRTAIVNFTSSQTWSSVNFYYEPVMSGYSVPSPWIHVVMVIDGEAARVYHNGVLALDTVGANVANFEGANVSDMRIGINYNNWFPTNCKLDDIGLWNRALTPEEVQALTEFVAIAPSGQALQYTLNGDGTSVTLVGPNTISGDLVVPDSVEIYGSKYGVTAIGEAAFKDCSGLTSVTLDTSLIRVKKYAFMNCENLESFEFTYKLEVIEANAFNSCSSLSHITSTSTHYGGLFHLDTIGEWAFGNCTQLESADLYMSSLRYIQDGAFAICGLNYVTLPPTLTYFGLNPFRFNPMSNGFSINRSIYHTDPESMQRYVYSDGMVIDRDNNSIVMANPNGIGPIPENIKTIGAMSFVSYHGPLFTLSDSITTIEQGAFFDIHFDTFVIPKNVTNIESNAFEGSETLKVLKFAEGMTNATLYSGIGTLQNQNGMSTHLHKIVYSSTIDSIKQINISDCDTIELLCALPPKVQYFGNGFGAPAVLIIPCGTMSAYQADEKWGTFTNIIESITGCLFTVDVTSNDDVKGTVSEDGTYTSGSTVILTASPNAGYQFVLWSDGNTDNPRTLVVAHDTSFMAFFVPIVHDTTYVHDTTTIHDTMIAYLVHISDTALVTRHEYDSAVVNNTYFDTFYVYSHDVDTMHILDTIIYNRYQYDTTILNVYQYDTTLVNIFDTVINNIYQYDTTIVNSFRFDTTLVFDTMIVNVYTCDTSIYNSYQFDTVIVNYYYYDTVTVENTHYYHDTTYTYIHDTVLAYVNHYVHDTTYINNYIRDTVYLLQTAWEIVHDTVWIVNYLPDTAGLQGDVAELLTLYIDSLMHDSAYIDNHMLSELYAYIDAYLPDTVTVTDTIYELMMVHDTIYIHDTVYVDNSGIGDVETTSAKIYQRDGLVVVEGAEGATVTIYDAVGRMFASKRDEYAPLTFDVPTSGAYLIRIGDAPARRIVVVR